MDAADLVHLLEAAAIRRELEMHKKRLRHDSAVLLAGVDPEHRAELAAVFSKLDAEACRGIDAMAEGR